jgi:hypothetical protein
MCLFVSPCVPLGLLVPNMLTILTIDLLPQMLHLDCNLFPNAGRSPGGSHGWSLGCSLDWGLRGCGHGLEGLHRYAELESLSIKDARSQVMQDIDLIAPPWNLHQAPLVFLRYMECQAGKEAGSIKLVKYMPCKCVIA